MATIHLNDGTFIRVKETAEEIDKIIRETKHKGKDEIFIKVTFTGDLTAVRRIQIKRIIEYYD